MAAYFSPEHLATLNHHLQEVHRQSTNLRQDYILRKYKSERAREYALYGFCRRLGILVRAIDLVFEGVPPEREDVPDQDKVDATIAIQSFVFNTFGCLDNLAWIWVSEKDVRIEDGKELSPKWVGLGKDKKRVRSSFSQEFRGYLDGLQEWFDLLKEFRDSLAHRIPLYIPPRIVTDTDEYNELEQASDEALQRADFEEYERLQAKQRESGVFRPWITHSLLEGARKVIFHGQLLNDYLTIDECGRKMLEELDR